MDKPITIEVAVHLASYASDVLGEDYTEFEDPYEIVEQIPDEYIEELAKEELLEAGANLRKVEIWGPEYIEVDSNNASHAGAYWLVNLTGDGAREAKRKHDQWLDGGGNADEGSQDNAFGGMMRKNFDFDFDEALKVLGDIEQAIRKVKATSGDKESMDKAMRALGRLEAMLGG